MAKLNKKLLQRSSDEFVVYAREFSSRGTSFVIVILGVILQASHTTLLMYTVSAFDEWLIKLLVSLGIGIFISSALAIFTLKHDGKNRKIENLINVFFYFEIFTNIFYYFNSIILDSLDSLEMKNYIFFAASLPFAYIMPFAIKQFAGIIKADDPIAIGSIDDPKPQQIEQDEIVQKIEQNKIAHQEQLVQLQNKIDELQQSMSKSNAIDNDDVVVIKNIASGKEAVVKIAKRSDEHDKHDEHELSEVVDTNEVDKVDEVENVEKIENITEA